MSHVRLAAPLVAPAVLAAACSSLPDADHAVVLTEMAIAVAREHSFGRSVWEVTNQGAAHHSLTICSGDEDECLGKPVLQKVLRKPERARDPASLPDETG